jgi:hypothetical protein
MTEIKLMKKIRLALAIIILSISITLLLWAYLPSRISSLQPPSSAACLTIPLCAEDGAEGIEK